MITNLLNNLEGIYNEVVTKLLPENIKKDVTILGVTGALDLGVMTQEDYDECDELADLILGDITVTTLDYVLMNPLVVDANSDITISDDNLVINSGGGE